MSLQSLIALRPTLNWNVLLRAIFIDKFPLGVTQEEVCYEW